MNSFFLKFKQNTLAYYSLIYIVILWITTIFAELICNDVPIMFSLDGRNHFPLVKEYSPQLFDLPYKKIPYKSEEVRRILNSGENFVLFPLIPYSYNSINELNPNPFPAPPSAENWLGTDDRGRDVLARIVYGLRLNFGFATVLAILAMVIGTVFGALQGYYGGRFDIVSQRAIEVWTSLPELYILLLATTLFQPTLFLLFIVLSLFSWVGFNDYARAEFLRIKVKDFITSAHTLGLNNRQIMFRHILPNALTPVLTLLPFRFGAAILALTSLDFLGLGVGDSYPSLGEMLAQAQNNLDAWWISLSVFVVLISVLLSFVFIGEGVRSAIKDESY